jgi:hypothetical protein
MTFFSLTPPKLSNFVLEETLKLPDTFLTGTLPSEIGLLTNLGEYTIMMDKLVY